MIQFFGRFRKPPPPPSLDGPGIRALYVFLRLREDSVGIDNRIVDALRNAGWFTHVILLTYSWQERPDAIRNPIVLRALATCRRMGLGVVWGRWLWVAWPEGVVRAPSELSHLHPVYYATAIATVQSEARSIGAVGTFVDAEPYGHSAQKELKSAVFDDNDRLQINRAINQSLRYTGPVDLIYPVSSGRSTHYAWEMAGLGEIPCCSKTYYSHGVDDLPPIHPPSPTSYVTHRIGLWGSYVGLGRDKDRINNNVFLTIAEVKGLDMDVVRATFPKCRGQWVFAGPDIVEVLNNWGSG